MNIPKQSKKTKSVKAWTVIFEGGYACEEITLWSKALHPIFIKKEFAKSWARELKQNANIRTRIVPCTITYQLPSKK